MSIVKCGEDEIGEYLELTRPKGEVFPCFIDQNEVLHDKIRIYQHRQNKEDCVSTNCLVCGSYIPEGSLVCKRCREAFKEDG